MKKLLAFIAAATALVSCSKTKELQQKVDQLTSKFDFSLEINEGPYCYALDGDLSRKRTQDIPFKINGNAEGLTIIPMLTMEWEETNYFDYEIEMTSESEGVLHVERRLYTEPDAGEIDCYLLGAKLSLMAFNADGMSSCRNLEFCSEAFYYADDACDLVKEDNKCGISATKDAGSYELTLRHIVFVPAGAKIEDMIDINDLYYLSNAFDKATTTVSEFTLTDSQKAYDEYEKSDYFEKDYKATITWQATSAEKTSSFSVIRREEKGETRGVGDIQIYLFQK